MKNRLNGTLLLTLIIALIILLSSALYAGNVATQIVTVEVAPISVMSVNGSSSGRFLLPIDPFASKQEGSLSYAITTNETNKKITGSISSNLPADCTLKMFVEAPGSAKSAGFVSLTSKPQDLVNGISKLCDKNKTILYNFSDKSPDEALTAMHKTVTLTITDET